ncbi:uncharacterized mitochondrial protein AtMg00300-like [Salvia hispanica]|uniref:uncharacterized mitochondrial protein AtMg00300-like n=1 Tax=Salvia hispanica TaxID=49212 RepID=UPI0020090676|nr:uncharacterized mitochondrial protein AtMg00300-like [Salvia hispanica]
MCLFKAKKKCGLHVCNAVLVTCDKAYANVVKTDKTVLWHNKIGHMSAKGLNILKKHAILSDSDVHDDLPFCDTCVLGKQHKVSFPTPTPANVSKDILEYVHMDVWGPASVSTHSGAVYFLSIIDDFSRKV